MISVTRIYREWAREWPVLQEASRVKWILFSRPLAAEFQTIHLFQLRMQLPSDQLHFIEIIICPDYRSVNTLQHGIGSKYRASQILRAATDGCPAGRQAGPHTAAASKHSLLFQLIFRVDGHAHRRTFAKRKR